MAKKKKKATTRTKKTFEVFAARQSDYETGVVIFAGRPAVTTTTTTKDGKVVDTTSEVDEGSQDNVYICPSYVKKLFGRSPKTGELFVLRGTIEVEKLVS